MGRNMKLNFKTRIKDLKVLKSKKGDEYELKINIFNIKLLESLLSLILKVKENINAMVSDYATSQN